MKNKKYLQGNINLLLFFLVSVIFFFGICYLWVNDWFMKPDDTAHTFWSKSAIEGKIEDLRSSRKKNVYESFEIAEEQFRKDRLKYTNEKYMFRLNFPQSWDNYYIEEKEKRRESNVQFDSYCFGTGYQDIFCVNVYPKNQWDDLTQDYRDGQKKISESFIRVFTYSINQSLEDFDSVERSKEVPSIIGSFELISY